MLKRLYVRLYNFIKIQQLKRKNWKTFLGVAIIGYGTAIAYSQTSNPQIDLSAGMSLFPITLISKLTIPVSLRKPIFQFYSKKYGVNTEELDRPYKDFATFSDFFTRKIDRKQYEAQLQDRNSICCPCDAQIINLSKLQKDQNVIVKNVEYSLSKLLFQIPNKDDRVIQDLKFNKQTELYQIILYLCPGDYHRFHSPYDINVKTLRDINGNLRPVNIKSILKYGGIVYQENARKSLHSQYQSPQKKFNYLGMAMVGALNVGDIIIHNQKLFKKGQQIGYFNLGSTIVMIIEVQPTVKWNKKIGDKVKFGERLLSFT